MAKSAILIVTHLNISIGMALVAQHAIRLISPELKKIKCFACRHVIALKVFIRIILVLILVQQV